MKKTHGLLLLLIVFVLGAYVGVRNADKFPAVRQAVSDERAQENDPVSLMLDFGDGRVRTFHAVAWQEGMTVADVLHAGADTQGFTIGSKDFGGSLGIFVETIDGVGGGTDRWWQYWVNNVYGTVGAGNQQVMPGDVVEWKFIRGQQ